MMWRSEPDSLQVKQWDQVGLSRMAGTKANVAGAKGREGQGSQEGQDGASESGESQGWGGRCGRDPKGLGAILWAWLQP